MAEVLFVIVFLGFLASLEFGVVFTLPAFLVLQKGNLVERLYSVLAAGFTAASSIKSLCKLLLLSGALQRSPTNIPFCDYRLCSVRFKIMKERLVMDCGALYLSKGKSGNFQGDDAHFVCAEKGTIGVADGVGGWWSQNVDPGKYARQLMQNCVEAIKDRAGEEDIDPKTVLLKAYNETKLEGSSTACILTLKNNHLHAANLGDSGFLVIREAEVVYKSPIQHYKFNHPYQLGKNIADWKKIEELKVPVKLGDIIVLGTDGLLDNLRPSDIKAIVNNHLSQKEEEEQCTKRGEEQSKKKEVDPEAIAEEILQFAYTASTDGDAFTPFAEASFAAGPEHFHMGGKRDDITVIVARVSRASHSGHSSELLRRMVKLIIGS